MSDAAPPLTISPSPPSSGLDPVDRDAMIRTVLAEAGSNPDGWGAVANTIKNRLATGKFGATPAAVVTAPGQFEVWSDGSAQKQDPTSPQYAAAGRVVDAVAAGALPDNSGGATHFFSPSGQAARAGDGRQQVPSWAQNQTASIGGNVFFAPQGRVTYQQTPGGGSAAAGPAPITFGGAQSQPTPSDPTPATSAAPSQQPSAPASDPGTDAILARWGVGSSGAASSASPPPAPAQGASDDATAATLARWSVPPATTAAAPQQAQAAPITFGGADAGAAPQDGSAQSGDASAAIGQGIISGVPVIGSALLSGVNRGVIAPLRALTKGESYDQALQEAQNFGAATAADHPSATFAGNMLGATAAMVPVAAAAPAAFGLKGASMLNKLGAAASTGAVMGGADSFIRSGGDPTATGYGALTGGAFGAAGPVAGEAIGAGANKLFTAIAKARGAAQAGVPIQVQNALIPALNQDGEAAIRAQLAQLGPDGMLADTGAATKGVAQGVALTPEGKALIGALDARKAGQNARIDTAVQGLGPGEDPTVLTAGLKAQRAAVSAGYDAVHAAAPPVDVSSVIGNIDAKLPTAVGANRTALQNLRNELVASPASIDPETGSITPETYVQDSQTLHNVRQMLDSMINYGDPGLGVEKGAIASNQGAIKGVRGALDDALKTQVPGMADQDVASSALAGQINAVKDGINTLPSPRGSMQPPAFKAAFDAKPVAEQVTQAKALVGEINRLVGVNKNDLGAMDAAMQGGGVNGEGGFGALKAKAVLGDAPVDNMLSTIANERQFGQTYNDVAGNAQSAFRTAAKASLDVTPSLGQNINLSGLTATGALAQGAKSMLYNPLVKILTASDTGARDAMLAKILSSTGPARDDFVNRLFQAAGYVAPAPAWAGGVSTAGNLLTQGAGDAYRARPLTIERSAASQ